MFEVAAQPPTMSPDVARAMIPTVRCIACRLAKRLPRHICLDDLMSAGFQGLVSAYARFDPQRGEAFESYAEFRIRGAMLDELRARDPLSRDQRTTAKQTAAATRTACGRLGRAPAAEEVAAELGVSLKTYWERVSTSASVVMTSIDADEDDDHPAPQLHDPHGEPADDQLARKEQILAVRQAIADLPPRLAQVLELHFGDGLTLKDIGARLGVTESRACQLVSEAARRVRESCPEHAGDDESPKHATRTSARRPQRARSAAMAA